MLVSSCFYAMFRHMHSIKHIYIYIYIYIYGKMCVYSIRGYFCLRYLHSDRPNQWRHDRGIIPNDALGKRLKSSMRWVNEYQHLSITNIEHVEFFSWMILQLSLWPSIHSQCFLFLRIRSCSAYDIYIYIYWLIDWLIVVVVDQFSFIPI